MCKKEDKIYSSLTDYAKLFDSLYAQLCISAYNKHINDLEVCKELVQEVFIEAYESGTSFDSENLASTFLYKKVDEKCKVYLKANNIEVKEVIVKDLNPNNVVSNVLKSMKNKQLAKEIEFSIGDYSTKKNDIKN
ncbi:hypothetical protein [Flavivirga jejuensis]|uniref:RNA polymerase sigma-70 region 2 domain-containing protein n=1 Tax=Flavivirga jejuensis TaxID=870487 RepID=A0ABT8WRD7_9FLAO|nr:hypothetical protein [Flavivirga jejuensis]MDO5975723.1 hypothetical protein [Flavivirga jejuensis]